MFLSVVTPMYNGTNYLHDYMDSLSKQTFKNFEVVIIDDGSTDGSAEIVEKYQNVLPIKLVKQSNLGISSAIKRGIHEATSNYIVLMDQDDRSKPGRLERFANAFSNGYELIMSGYELIDNKGKAKNEFLRMPSYLTDTNILMESIKRNYFLGSAMGFLNKNDIEFNLQAGGTTDYDIALKMLLNGYRFYYIDEILLEYRIHSNNVSSNYTRIKSNAMVVLEQFSSDELLNALMSRGHSLFEIYLTLIILHLFKGETDKALEFLNKVETSFQISEIVSNERVFLEYLFYKSVILFKKNDFKACFETLKRAVDIKPLNASVANNIGVLSVVMEEMDEAKEWFETATEINISYLDAARNLKSLENESNVQNYIFTERLLRTILIHSEYVKGI